MLQKYPNPTKLHLRFIPEPKNPKPWSRARQKSRGDEENKVKSTRIPKRQLSHRHENPAKIQIIPWIFKRNFGAYR
jgi:hypothetical protein